MDHELLSIMWAQVWQVTLLIVVVAVLVRLIGRNHPHFSHALWVVVLLKAVTPPLWSSPSGVFSWLQSPTSAEEVPAEVKPVELTAPRPEAWDAIEASRALSAGAPRTRNVAETCSRQEMDASEDEVSELEPLPAASVHARGSLWVAAFLGIWLTGSFGSLLLALFRWRSCHREIRRAGRVRHPEAERLLEHLTVKLKLRRRVRLIVSESRIGPAVVGIFRPTVLIPARMLEGKPPADLEPILAHELIHIRRGDLWIGWLQVVAQAAWWFHPLVWWAGRWVKHEAERCCDEEVVAELACKPARYARALLNVLELKRVLKPVPLLPGVKPVEITSQRLERIMLLRQGCRKRTPWWCWLAMLLTAALTLPGAAFVATGKEEAEKEQRSAPDDGALVLESRTYQVGTALKKLQLMHGLESKRGARRMLVEHLKAVTRFPANQDRVLANGRQVGTPSFYVKGDKLIVRHSPAVHREVQNQIEILSKQGLQEVVVKTRFITVNRQVLEQAGVDWIPISSTGRAGQVGESRSVRIQQRTHRMSRNLVKTLVPNPEPMTVAVLDASQLKTVLEVCQLDARCNIVQCPHLTVFSGQSGKIEDTVKRPWFAVGVEEDGQAKIRVISEGISLNLRPRLAEDQIHLESHLTVSDIRGESVANLPATEREGSNQTEPRSSEVITTQLDAAVNLKAGTVLLLGGVTPPLDPRRIVDEDRTNPPHIAGRPGQQLFVLLQVDIVRRDGELMFGQAVNSDAGVTGTVCLDKKRFQVVEAQLTGNPEALESSPESRRMVTKTYSVADLVVPLPRSFAVDLRGKTGKVDQNDSPLEDKAENAAAKESAYRTHGGLVAGPQSKADLADLDGLIKLIKGTVQPDSWAASGSGAIEPYETTLSIVVRHHESVHQEIGKLLEQLRRFQEVQVCLVVRTIEADQLPGENVTEKLGRSKRVVLTPQEAAALMEAVRKDKSTTLRQLFQATLFNGQTVNLVTDSAAWDFSPSATADRQFVRLSIQGKTDARQTLNSLLTLGDRQSVLLEMTNLSERELKHRAWMLVTPEMVVPEEEEALLGIEQ